MLNFVPYKKDWLWQILLDFVTIGLTRQQSLPTSSFKP